MGLVTSAFNSKENSYDYSISSQPKGGEVIAVKQISDREEVVQGLIGAMDTCCSQRTIWKFPTRR